MFDHDIDVVLRFAISSGGSANAIGAVLASVLSSERKPERYFSYGRSKMLAPFFEFFSRQTLDAIYQPDEDGSYSSAYQLVTDSFSEHRESAIAKVPSDILIEWCNLSPSDRYPFAAATCRLFENRHESNNKLCISETAKSLLNNAPVKLEVVREYISRFQPRSGSGSLADTLEQRIPLLDQLNPENNHDIAKAVSRAEAELRRWVDAERKREADDERRDAGSFE
ncbi:hypothetical protein [Chelativorans salis]|uniref:Uncharacterized protein n=1 Tax=Chelativorans salis TaxID=2978478 RepID=A0ABT2LN26_9HYPH|nr:hypothetical protein [Chelativorans sp. EGI FJ00035]MCT7375479.1 hypothetical protein [Chelativorans sp. EGI FJ00035]